MGLTSLVPPNPSGAFAVSSEPGIGAGAIFATAVVIYLTAYLNIVVAGDSERRQLRWLLIVATVPLLATFAGIVLFESLSVIEIGL